MMLEATLLKELALQVGFDACGLAVAREVDAANAQAMQHYLQQGYHGQLGYMGRNIEKRLNPALLEPGAQTVLVGLVHYKQPQRQAPQLPQIAQYAYGEDYHPLIKGMLHTLLGHLRDRHPGLGGRAFVDTAPLLERYWAVQAGLGWIGNNGLLINPRLGSLTLIGVLLLHGASSAYDSPQHGLSCGTCTRCMQQCPTQAIVGKRVLDARKCISYHTIEKAYFAQEQVDVLEQSKGMHRYVFGCDICQDVCPWNKKSPVHSHTSLLPAGHPVALDKEQWLQLSQEQFEQQFAHSPLARAGWQGMRDNVQKVME